MAQAQASGGNLVSGTDLYWVFDWRLPMLVKRASMRVNTAYSGGTPVSNAYFRIYAINSSGQPGKLLIDLGLLGTANVSLNTGAPTLIQTALAGTGFMLLPGEYFADFLPIFSGGVTAPQMSSGPNLVTSGRLGHTATLIVNSQTSATGGSNPAPDPANVAGYAGQTATRPPIFALSPT